MHRVKVTYKDCIGWSNSHIYDFETSREASTFARRQLKELTNWGISKEDITIVIDYIKNKS